jgi:catechol 2,3-dioxygenase-like lactoylglutathione lyase family enzyme
MVDEDLLGEREGTAEAFAPEIRVVGERCVHALHQFDGGSGGDGHVDNYNTSQMNPAKHSETGPGPGGDRDTDDGARRDVWRGIDHVQLAIPVGSEDRAREFYVGVLGLTEVPKPPVMAERGGAWFESGATVVHVGADADFVPARKAHPALLVTGLEDFINRTRLAARWSDEIPGTVRCHIDDPFGNRIELVEAGERP